MSTKTKNCAICIMASGASSRFGKNKLTNFFLGKPLCSYIMEIAATLQEYPSIVVTRWDKVVKEATKNNLQVFLHNEPFVSDTIRIGTQYLKNHSPKGIMFCVSDQPLLSSKTVERMLHIFSKNPNSIVRLEGKNTDGSKRFANPVIFPSSVFEELEHLPKNETGRYVIKKHKDISLSVYVNDPLELLDADTMEELNQIEIMYKINQQF